MLELPRGVRRLFRLPWRSGARVRDDVDDEIAFHLGMRTEELTRRGMDEDRARQRAEREFGDVDRARRELRGEDERLERRARWRAWLDDLRQDLTFGVRGLRERPGFAAAAVVALALGIGGTTAVFTVVRSVLIEPLPYERPGQLVRMYQYDVDDPTSAMYVSAPHFKAARGGVAAFEELAALYTYRETGADLMVGDRPERIRLLRVSAGYFRVLRANPVVGRTFTREEETADRPAVVSAGLRERLGDGRATPGRVIELDGEPYTVVGVVPAAFEDPIAGRVDVWVPESGLYDEGAQYPQNHFLTVVGRLAPGVTAARAQAELDALHAALAERWPDAADESLRVVPLREDLVASARPTLLILFGAVAFVLLLACVNVANLMLVRALGRAREMAVRSAIGAGRGRIARQLLTESLLLAAAGGAAGVLVAVVGVDVLVAVGRDAVPRASDVALDAPVLGFAAAVTLLTGLAFGLAPALHTARTPPARTLRASGSRGTADSRGYIRVRGALVAGQVALALVLLVGASVLATSVYRLSRVDLGVRTEGILTFGLNLPGGRYDAAARAAFHRRTTRRISELPGVAAAAAVSRLPATGNYHSWGTRALTGPLSGDEERGINAQHRVIEGGYFDALGIPLLEGRSFDERDDAESAPVAVVSETAAEELFPGTPAIGRRIRGGGATRQIVGVVPDIAVGPEGERTGYVYHAHAQFADNRNWAMKYVVAADRGDPEALLPAVRREIAAADPMLVVHLPETLADVLGRGRSTRRFAFVLTAVFAGIALALATLGLYGVLAYTVGQRTREIGVRIALGAEPRRVAGLVVRHGLLVTGIGLAFGVVGALALGRVLASLVFRTEPTDPRIMITTAAVLTLVALGAALVPAYRAMRVSPRMALEEM